MSKGKAKSSLLGIQGIVGHKEAPDWSFIYSASLVKDPDWNPGDRVVLPDGREFRYAKSIGSCETGQGCEFTYTGYTAYTSLAVSADKGDKELTVPAATHAALTKDELRGGYVVIFNDADSTGAIRGIVGNDASILNVAFKIYLDGPLSANIVAGTAAIETYQNPYNALRTATLDTFPKAGVPAAYVSAALMYFWCQVKGPCWISPQSGVGDDQGQKGAFWRHDGSLDKADTALATTVPNGSTSQYAGYCMEGSNGGNGPLFMLQG